MNQQIEPSLIDKDLYTQGSEKPRGICRSPAELAEIWRESLVNDAIHRLPIDLLIADIGGQFETTSLISLEAIHAFYGTTIMCSGVERVASTLQIFHPSETKEHIASPAYDRLIDYLRTLEIEFSINYARLSHACLDLRVTLPSLKKINEILSIGSPSLGSWDIRDAFSSAEFVKAGEFFDPANGIPSTACKEHLKFWANKINKQSDFSPASLERPYTSNDDINLQLASQRDKAFALCYKYIRSALGNPPDTFNC
ncbi:MAG: hypothetical protein R3A13_10365, partial [Bdellovibrionota bacterium]